MIPAEVDDHRGDEVVNLYDVLSGTVLRAPTVWAAMI